MTVWNPRAVASFTVGRWEGVADKVMATAVALAASGGDDKWRWDPLPGRRVPLVGLWALPQTYDAAGQPDPLERPEHSADVARLLWGLAGRRWDWHPVYNTVAYELAVGVAMDAVADIDLDRRAPLARLDQRAATIARPVEAEATRFARVALRLPQWVGDRIASLIHPST